MQLEHNALKWVIALPSLLTKVEHGITWVYSKNVKKCCSQLQLGHLGATYSWLQTNQPIDHSSPDVVCQIV
jgi:hypothetical protein